jgi:hypothetical protein
MVSAMLVFLAADIAFISHAIDVTIRHGASMMIMFGFEVNLNRDMSDYSSFSSQQRLLLYSQNTY